MALHGPVDRGYLSLLAYLRGDKPHVSPDTVQVAIGHYLVHLPPTQPTPTPLTSSVISSPVWLPLSLKTCLALGNTFRSSVRSKLSDLGKKKRGLFDASVSSDLTSWLRGILAGLKEGAPLVRMSASGGILLGVNDLKDSKLSHRLFRDVEESVVLAFAEAAEEASAVGNEWTNEFTHKKDDLQDRANLSILLASQYFSLISAGALSALDLLSLASHCLSAVEIGFESGKYLQFARGSLVRRVNASFEIPEDSGLERSIDALMGTDNFTCMPFLCRLLARIIGILADTSFRSERKWELWKLISSISQTLHALSSHVEEDWRSSPLSEVHSDTQLSDPLCKATEKLWILLKTHLFSALMLQQSILDIILFHIPPSNLPATSSISHLTSTILKTLSSLSFIIASFGGVLAGSTSPGTEPSFPELKKVFCMSIDILSTDAVESERLVLDMIRDADVIKLEPTDSSKIHFVHAKRSFVLACIEQFISVLNDSLIEGFVIPFCEPHLGDPPFRQTFESAHSVMLSIFATHAEKTTGSVSGQQKDVKGKEVERPGNDDLARRLVPGYAQILLENTREGGLTIAQLRLAYAALVRSATTGKNPYRDPPPKSTPPSLSRTSRWWGNSTSDEEFPGDPALAWLCIEQLLRALSSSSNSHKTHQALSLTLISLIPNVSLQILPRVLKEVERVVDAEVDPEKRRVLVENVFEEILERVGDGEREVAMRWWFDMAKKWEVLGDGRVVEQESTS